MSTFKKAKVILLPTGFIARRNEIGLQAYKTNLRIINNTEEENLIFYQQHLYIISDDEIEKGDYILNIKTNNIFRADSIEYLESHNIIEDFDKSFYIDFDKSFYINSKYAKKIIATTDSSLKIAVPGRSGQPCPLGLVDDDGLTYKLLPQPSQQFIQKFVEEYNKGNVINDVLVEYETLGKYGNVLLAKSPLNNEFNSDMSIYSDYLKINPKDNTITIKKVKDNWNKEEVDRLLDEQASKTTAEMLEKFKGYKSREEVEKLIRKAIVSVSPNPAKGFIDKWIEENL